MRVQTKLSLTLACGASLVAGAVCAFVFLQVQSAAAELTRQVEMVSRSSAYEAEFSKLTKLVEDTQEEREQIASYVLLEDNMITFLAEVENAGRALGLSLTTTQLSVIENPPSGQTLEMEVSFSGSEDDVPTLLQLFENLPYASSVTRFSYQRDGVVLAGASPTVSGMVALSVSIQSYEN